MKHDAEKTFSIALGWKVVLFVGMLMFLAIPVFIGYLPFLYHYSWVPTVSCLIAAVALTFLFVLFLVYLLTYKVSIYEDTLGISKIRGERRVSLASITGYRYVPKSGFVLYTMESKRKIVITEYIGKQDKFAQWLSAGYKDLDAEEAMEEAQELFQENENVLGRESKVDFFNKVKSFCKLLNILGMIFFAWLTFVPIYYKVAVCLNVSIVLFAFLTALIFRRYINIDTKRNSVKPSILWAFIFPSIGLGVRPLLDFNIIYSSKLWIYTTILAIVMIMLFFVRSKEYLKNKFLIVLIPIVIFGYSYGVVIEANCLLDRALSEQYDAVVIDKSISSGKVTEYYLTVGHWGPLLKDNDVSVSKELFDNVEVDGIIQMYILPGWLGIPWFDAG
jgi:hypothetical protein